MLTYDFTKNVKWNEYPIIIFMLFKYSFLHFGILQNKDQSSLKQYSTTTKLPI